MLRCSLGVIAAAFVALAAGAQPAAETKARLLIAFSSYRDRPRHPNIFFYEHDGVAVGKIVGTISTTRQADSADAHPSLTQDGRFCAFTFEKENTSGRVRLWDVKGQKDVELPDLNASASAHMSPSLSGDGKLLAFAAWSRPGGPSLRWHVFLYDTPAKKLLDLPSLNSQTFDERMPALSGDGRFLAYASNARSGMGLTDSYLYDRQASKVLPLPEMNSRHMDIEPSLNADGRLVAFVSDRPGGLGGRDIYLFDRALGKMLPLPGLNSVGHEHSPSLSADGRVIAFVSERLGGAGERDIYLYDRLAQKLLPTPGLNAKQEDFDPCVVVLTDK